MILKLKSVTFTIKKNPILMDEVDIDKILIPNKVSSREKSYRCFIC